MREKETGDLWPPCGRRHSCVCWSSCAWTVSSCCWTRRQWTFDWTEPRMRRRRYSRPSGSHLEAGDVASHHSRIWPTCQRCTPWPRRASAMLHSERRRTPAHDYLQCAQHSNISHLYLTASRLHTAVGNNKSKSDTIATVYSRNLQSNQAWSSEQVARTSSSSDSGRTFLGRPVPSGERSGRQRAWGRGCVHTGASVVWRVLHWSADDTQPSCSSTRSSALPPL